jgi:hypothetical protein
VPPIKIVVNILIAKDGDTKGDDNKEIVDELK